MFRVREAFRNSGRSRRGRHTAALAAFTVIAAALYSYSALAQSIPVPDVPSASSQVSTLDFESVTNALGGRLDVIALLTAIGGLVTAITSLFSVRNSRVMIEAQLWPDFNRRYKTDEMSQAIKALTNWHYDHPADFVELWLEQLRQGDLGAKQLDSHRRTLSMFFLDIAALYKDRIISRRFARFVANQAGLNVFYEVVVPMNMAQRPARTKEAVRTLKRLIKQVEGGMFDPRKHGR